ncbi:MAG: hypothetical protein QQN63_05830 [Nitrosopumilus sp.]
MVEQTESYYVIMCVDKQGNSFRGSKHNFDNTHDAHALAGEAMERHKAISYWIRTMNS